MSVPGSSLTNELIKLTNHHFNACMHIHRYQRFSNTKLSLHKSDIRENKNAVSYKIFISRPSLIVSYSQQFKLQVPDNV